MHSTRRGVICVVTNDPVPNGNAVLTYLNDGVGNLSPLRGSPFKTNGTAYTTKHVRPRSEFDAVGGYPSTVRHQWRFRLDRHF
jgi:hypothetical protein